MRIYSKIKPFLVFTTLFFSVLGFSQSNNFKVTLDAGHGGHDFDVRQKIQLALNLYERRNQKE